MCLLGHVPLLRGAEPVEPQDPEALLKMTFDLARYFTPERQRNLLNSELVCVYYITIIACFFCGPKVHLRVLQKIIWFGVHVCMYRRCGTNKFCHQQKFANSSREKMAIRVSFKGVCVCSLVGAPAEGNYCALKDRDGCFYRVRILKFSRPLEFMFHHKEKAKVS